MERVAYCLVHTLAFILTKQEHKLIHIVSEKPCRPHAGNAYWILKSSCAVKMELALWHQGRKK